MKIHKISSTKLLQISFLFKILDVFYYKKTIIISN